MNLVFRIHDGLAVAYQADNPNKWVLTLCRGGFQFATGQRVNDGETYMASCIVDEFLAATKCLPFHAPLFPRDKEINTYKVQDKMVTGWLACDTGEWTYPIARYAFEEITDAARLAAGRMPFEQGDIVTARTKICIQ